MGRKHTKNATSGATAEKAEALDQINGEEIQDAVEASGDTPEPVADPEEDKSEILSAELAKHVSYWATQIQTINLPRRLFGSRRLYKDGVEIKGFKADLKLVYVFLIRLHEVATNYAAMQGHEGVPFALVIPVGVVRDAFGLTEATSQRYLAMLGDGQNKKTGENFFGLVEWKQGCKGFQLVNIHDLRVKDVAGFELK